MKIINKTKWQTRDLRAFASKVLLLEIDNPQKRKEIIVTFVHSRTRSCSGYVHVIGGRKAWIRVPTPKNILEHDRCGLAMVLAHEFAHLRGHAGGRTGEKDLRGTPRYDWKGHREYYAWAMEMPLRAIESKSSPVDSMAKHESEIAKIDAAMKRWESKLKRCETALKKYRQKRAYRIKKLAACKPSERIEQ